MPHMPNLFELIIILVIVLVLFGGNRVAKLGGELGSAVRNFREGLGGGEKPEITTTEDQNKDPVK